MQVGSGMVDFAPDSLAGRIEKRLEKLDKNPAQVSKEATGKSDAVRKIFAAARDGTELKPRMDTLQGLARVLGTTTDWLAQGAGPEEAKDVPSGVSGPIDVSGSPVPFGGIVQAGDFRLVDEYFNQDYGDHMVPLSVPRHPEYLQLPQHAWLVRGDSMDQAGIIDGMWAVAASYADYVDKIGELDNGSYVIVERARHGGSEIERTVKEVQFARRGMRLIPRSSNAIHKEFFIDLDPEADSDTEQVRILGVVLWFGRDVDPRSRR